MTVQVGSGLSTSDPYAVREWLASHHPKQLAALDKFEIELRLGRLSAKKASGSEAMSKSMVSDRLFITLKTVELLKQMVGQTRYKNAAELLALLRGLGRELQTVGGFREPVIGNIVRRVMAAVREEALANNEATTLSAAPNKQSSDGGRLSLQSMLWALPQHVKSPNMNRSLSRADSRQRTESFAETDPTDMEQQLPEGYFTSKPELKQSVMEAIQEISSDLEDLHKNINDQAVNHIHAGEIVLTYGRSKTVEHFLKAAAAKKRQFQVVVCEAAPVYSGHEMAKSLADAGIDTIVINDSALFAIMARVNKVLIPAHAVLANGGLIASSGINMVALAALNNSIPVVCLTGMFKLCPMFPHEGQDTLNDLLSPSTVVEYADLTHKSISKVDFVNPLHDYIKPEHINLYVTNVGSFQPSYIYRLLAEYYHSDDWNSFE